MSGVCACVRAFRNVSRTKFLGLSVGVFLQFAEVGVLLGQQHFDVLHAHSDYPGADVRLKSVDTLVRQRGDAVDAPPADIINPHSLWSHGAHEMNEVYLGV